MIVFARMFGAVNPLTGQPSALIAPTVNTAYMNYHPTRARLQTLTQTTWLMHEN